MDFAAKRINFSEKAKRYGAAYWSTIALAGLSALLALMAAKLIWNVPKPFLITSGIGFLFSSLAFSISGSPLKGKLARRSCLLVSLWLTSTAGVLALIYWVDRGAWIWSALTGYDTAPTETVNDHKDFSIASFLESNQQFATDPGNPNNLVLNKGTFVFNETVVIPKGLKLSIKPGVSLRFGAGRSLISYSPIEARGTKIDPILFTAKTKWLKWGVVGVVDARNSVFEHVKFEHGRWAILNGKILPGNLSLLNSDSEILSSKFFNTYGKDAVYVHEGKILLKNNIFQNAYKDCLDMDNGHGRIYRNRFIDCDDEAIDLSGNYDVRIEDNVFLDKKGGRIAVDQKLEKEVRSLNVFGYSNRENKIQ